MDQAAINEQVEMAPADMSLGSALNVIQIATKPNQLLQETEARQRPFVSILNIIQMPVKQNTVKSNPMAPNTNEPVPSSIPEDLPYGMVALSYANKDQLNQSEDSTMQSYTGKTCMVVNEEVFEQSIPENASTKPLITEEGNQDVQLDYNQNVSTIEVPLITDPNTTPELVKFRPGIYEGDAIPPVYSEFSIFAVGEDYMPQIPASLEPAVSIIPEPVYEEQVIPENETTNETEQFIESDGTNLAMNNEEHPPALENAQITKQAMNPQLTDISGKRFVDARLLVTLRNTRLILIYKGYHFRRNYRQGLKIRWQCVDQKCSAYLYSYENKVTVDKSTHDHLGIIRQKNTPEKPIESKAVYSLEEAISTMADHSPAKDQNADLSVLGACNMETITLLYSNEAATQTSPPHKENIFPSQAPNVFCSENTTIYHDPSLEITVKNSSNLPENDKTIPHAMFSGSENAVTSLPDPLDYCVTSYEQNSPQNNATSGSSHQVFHSSYNDMLVPKDVKAKVTLTSIPQISEPQVYYDGKLAQPTTDQITYANEFMPTDTLTISSTNPVSTLTALSSFNPRNAAIIPRAQVSRLSSQMITNRSGGVSRGNISLFGVTAPLKVLKTYNRNSRVIKN